MSRHPITSRGRRYQSPAKNERPRNNVTQRYVCAHNSIVKARIMPCQQHCEMKRLNFQLKDIKIDKVETLREIFEVTVEIGRDYPHRREEMNRSKVEIYEKLTTAVAELLIIEDEIVRGCTTCRDN